MEDKNEMLNNYVVSNSFSRENIVSIKMIINELVSYTLDQNGLQNLPN